VTGNTGGFILSDDCFGDDERCDSERGVVPNRGRLRWERGNGLHGDVGDGDGTKTLGPATVEAMW